MHGKWLQALQTRWPCKEFRQGRKNNRKQKVLYNIEKFFCEKKKHINYSEKLHMWSNGTDILLQHAQAKKTKKEGKENHWQRREKKSQFKRKYIIIFKLLQSH